MRQRADACAGGAAGRHRRQPDAPSIPPVRRASVQPRRHVATWCWRTCITSTTSPTAAYEYALNRPLPTPAEIKQPQQQPSAAPYFTSWVEPQVVRALEHQGLSPKEAQYEADYGGLKIKLSIDLNLQQQAQAAVDDELPAGEGLPSASLVAISNKTGEVRAMVSGDSTYQQSPFNLATMGYRQPGSSFKLFTLAAALSRGVITPYTEFDSHQLTIHVREDKQQPVRRQRVHGGERHRPLPRPQLRQRLQRLDPDDGGHRHIGQQRLRPAGHGTGGRDGSSRQVRPPDGDPLPDLQEPVDDPRRSEAPASPRSTWRTLIRPSPTAATRSTTRSSATARVRSESTRSPTAASAIRTPSPTSAR